MSPEVLHRSDSDDGGAKRAITEKLRLLKSPVVESDDSSDEGQAPLGASLPDLSQYGKRPGPLRDMPEFKRVRLSCSLPLLRDTRILAKVPG